MPTRVVHCRRESYDVYGGRPGPLGNPFVVGRDGTRDEVIAKYREWVWTQPHLIEYIKSLRGKTIGCWCKPKPCHCDVIAEIADEGTGGLYEIIDNV